MATPSYSFYTSTYHGSIPEAQFDSTVDGAQAFVDWVIGYKTVATAYESDYELAICAAVDVYAQYGTGLVDGFSIGSFRMDRPNDGRTTANEIAVEAVTKYLAKSGLLWSGVR